MNIPFTIGSQYEKLEIIKIFNPNAIGWPSKGYFSYTVNGEKWVLVFTNIGESSNINGKIFNYSNRFSADRNKFFWASTNGDSLEKGKLLKYMYDNPSKVLIFIREEKNSGPYKYVGRPKSIIETYRSCDKKIPSDFIFNFSSVTQTNQNIVKNLSEIYAGLLDGLVPSQIEEIGLLGEIFFNNIIHKKESGISILEKKLGVKIDPRSVKWMYQINKRADHDFQIKTSDRTIYIEVKSTKSRKVKKIYMSKNEVSLANKVDDYYIFTANNVQKTDKSFEFFTWKEFQEKFNINELISYEAERK